MGLYTNRQELLGTVQEGFELQAVYGYAALIPGYNDSAGGTARHFRLPIPGQPDISFTCTASFSM
jgi:hypothetical protein